MEINSQDGIREYVRNDSSVGEITENDGGHAHGATTSDFIAQDLADDEARANKGDSRPLSDDPVRMYLKEIGQVPLLDSNREMWLSTQIAAERHLESLRDELMSLDKQSADRHKADYLDVERFAYRRLSEDWDKLKGAATERGVDAPDFIKVLMEAQETIVSWDRDAESYIRGYLKQGNWGRNEDWTVLAQAFFTVVHALYLFPFEHLTRMQRYYRRHARAAAVEGI